ncbi:MAG TPA: cupin domain-containing protein [Terriglobales bacterium]
MSQKTIIRKPLLSVPLQHTNVTSVEVREISFEPGQETGRHLHPCPVVGHIAEGTAVIQVEGQDPQYLETGSAFYEPAATVIAHFDNASATKPMKFVAYYLLNGDQQLIEMLPAR